MTEPGKGSIVRSSLDAPAYYKDLRRIVVAFDTETFARLRARAVANKTSFAEQVRQLVALGELPVDERAREGVGT